MATKVQKIRLSIFLIVSSTVLLGFFKTDLLNLMDSDPKLGVRFVYQLARIVAERLRRVTEGTYE